VPLFATDQSPHVYPFTQAKLASILPWAVKNYMADPNRIYGIGESMGGYGHVNWSLRQPNLFAAIFLKIPVIGPWLRIPSLIDVLPSGSPTVVATTNDTLPDGTTLYNDATNTATWIAQDCSRNLPYISWSMGRNDRTLGNHAMWSNAINLANALKACHYGFSFVWSNGGHDTPTAQLENILIGQYQTDFAKNVSYPAFNGFTLDGNYGNGDFNNGDVSGTINSSWQWKVVSDTSASWVASFSNSRALGQAAVDVTVRNAQAFKPLPGTTFNWSTSTGQSGKVTVDSFGLVTVPAIQLTGSATITLTIH